MPGNPLTVDYAAMGLAYALSQRWADAPVALAVPAGWNGTLNELFAATGTETTHKAHSAVVNLIQGAKQRGISTRDISIYCTKPPTYADKGMYITQVQGT